MSKKSIIIIVIVAVVVAISAAIYFTIKAAKAKQQNGGKGGKWINIASENTAFPLTIGSKGKAVKVLQIQTGVTVDGVFGDQTKGGVLSYYSSSKPQVSKEDFVLILTSESGIEPTDFEYYYTPTSKAYEYVKIMAGEEIPSLTYDDYIALAQKVFGLQPSDFNQ